MDAMPECVEQELPAGSAFVLTTLVSEGMEQRLDPFSMTYLRDALRPRDQGPESPSTDGNPFGNWNGESTLARERIGHRQRAGEPLAQDVLPHFAFDLECVRQAERELGDLRIEKGRAPLQSMRHQAAIDLEQEIVREPIRAIERLRVLQLGSFVRRDSRLRLFDTLTPDNWIAQHAEVIQQTAMPHPTAAEPARSEQGSIPSIAREELVSPFPAEHDLHMSCGLLRQYIRRQDRVVGHGIIHGRRDLRKRRPEVVLGDFDLDVLGADGSRDLLRLCTLVMRIGAWEPSRECPYRAIVQPCHAGEQCR